MKARIKTDGTLEDALMEILTSSTRTSVRKLLKYSRVLVDGETVTRGDLDVSPGQSLEIVRQGKKKSAAPASARKRLPFSILMEDEHIVVVDKPAGMLSIATSKERTKTLYRMVSDYVKSSEGGSRRIFIVHRLDRDVSGVMVLAKDQGTKRRMQSGWESAEKVYRAVVDGRPPRKQGTVTSWLCQNSANRVYECRKGTEGAEEAVTHYKLLRTRGSRSAMEIRIETGRKHQIRVHMASLGCPVSGDRYYGSPIRGMSGIALHALELSFDHPATGKRVKLKSPIPARMKKLL